MVRKEKCEKCHKYPDGGQLYPCDNCSKLLCKRCGELTTAEIKCMHLKTNRKLVFVCECCETGFWKVQNLTAELNELKSQLIRFMINCTCSSEKPLSANEEKQKRASSVIFFNIKEPINGSSSLDEEANTVGEILSEIDHNINDYNVKRLGKYEKAKNRPVKVTFSSTQDARKVLKNKHKILNKFANVRVYGDQAGKQMKSAKTNLDEMMANGDKTEFVPYEKRPKGIFNSKGNTPTRYAAKSRRDRQMSANAMVDSKVHMKRSSSRLSTLARKLRKLQDAGINYNFKPVHVPAGIKQEKSPLHEPVPTHRVDPYDSDIEVKIPLKKSTKSVPSKSLSRKLSGKSKSASNKVLLAKSLDSVKALLSSPKPSSKASVLKTTKSIKKVAKAESVDTLRKDKKAKPKVPRGITKKTKKITPLNTDTVKKIAQELIRKRGDSILNVFTSTKKLGSKKKSDKRS